MDKSEFEKLAKWSDPKEVQTKHGPRMLRKAELPDGFWDVWKAQKDAIKALGGSVGKDDFTGEWSLTWWQELSAEVQAERKQAVEESKAACADIEIPCPDGLEYMPFQKAGIRYGLSHTHVLIGDQPGLGKTIETAGIINADPSIKTVLIICPKSLKINWQRELEKWLVRAALIGLANDHYPKGADIVIMSYEGAGKFFAETHAQEFDMLVLDEAHYIKSNKTLRSKNIKGQKANESKGIEAIEPIKARRHVRLTGTPIVNRPSELHNIIEDLHPNFSNFFSFAKRYCGASQSRHGWDFSGASNLDELQQRLRETIMVRRLKEDVLTELPPKIRQIIEIDPETSEQRKAVRSEQSFEDESESRLAALRAKVELSKAESEEAYKLAAEALAEASQLTFTEISRLRHETALAKIPAVIAHIVQSLEDNESKIVIAIHHHDVADALMAGLKEFNPVKLTGEDSEKSRQAAVDAFQNDPQVRVFIGSIQAAGVGITLTASSHVVFAELDWVPGNVTQFEDRCHRIGQADTVLVQHIVLSESIDARMVELLVSKQRIIDSALDKDHPERKAPVYTPKSKPATQGETVQSIEQAAASFTPEQIKAIQSGLRLLASMDEDFAAEKNGQGFSKVDGLIGHSLAGVNTLSPKQAVIGAKLINRYRKQLPDDLVSIVGKKILDS